MDKRTEELANRLSNMIEVFSIECDHEMSVALFALLKGDHKLAERMISFAEKISEIGD